jgi:hypothetical protein
MTQYLTWLGWWTRTLLPPILRARYFSTEVLEEISGISEGLGIPEEDLMLYNFMYESAAYCTSIVV